MRVQQNIITLFTISCFLATCYGYAQQRQEDTTLSTEIVEDTFQQHYFEALKQKSIENFDRAIESLLICKQLDPNNLTIDFELGKCYYQINQYAVAQSYLENVLKQQPENYWFLQALMQVYISRVDNYNMVNVGKELNIKNRQFQENLVKIYIEQKEYKHAERVLDTLEEKQGITVATKNLRAHLASKMFEEQATKQVKEVVIEKDIENPVAQYTKILEQLIATDNREALLQVAEEALNNYPTQPYFYYTGGLAYNKAAKYKEAAKTLEMALDYLIDDATLQKNIYKELALAYSALGNTKKSEHYLQLIK